MMDSRDLFAAEFCADARLQFCVFTFDGTLNIIGLHLEPK